MDTGFRTGSAVNIALAAGAAYYLGSWIGLQLRLPPATPSVLWPPNAILTALLLFVPRARWASVLLGAAVAHFAVELQVWSPAIVSALFLTNCSEALLAAGLIRYFSDQPTKFDTLRRVSLFLVTGGLIAPFVSSFLDAAAVSVIHGEDYWSVWKMRLVSNVLAQLAIVPAIAGVLNRSHRILQWPPRRWLEAVGISAGFIVVSLVVSLDAGRIGLANTPFAPFLPLLLLTAVRFGSAGLGLAVLGTVLLALTSTLTSDAMTAAVSSEALIRTLQIFLISATVPLMCVGALVEERQKVVTALRASDMLKSSILTSIPSLVAVIDPNGRIVTVNEGWREAHAKGVMSEFSGESGAPYLDVWEAAADRGSSNARAAYDGIRSVLEGSASKFVLEYCSDVDGADRWWMMSVVPLKSLAGGAVITHTDISARKHAEFEAQRSRDELVHASRVWIMGELTAALSHQLNQPLTGIIGNANAGRRFLDLTPPNIAEVRHILTDILEDAHRASDVTRAIRDMLRSDVSQDELLDVNEVVRDTTMLVTTQASSRSVSLELQLAPSLLLVRGKRVQLRQVVLNLTMNAIESMAEHDTTGRKVVSIRTEPIDTTAVQVSVVDTGCGLPQGSEERVFDPLFTTKDYGMGMGLAIARAIIEAHNGTMSADKRPTGGTVFRFTLPVSLEQSVV